MPLIKLNNRAVIRIQQQRAAHRTKTASLQPQYSQKQHYMQYGNDCTSESNMIFKCNIWKHGLLSKATKFYKIRRVNSFFVQSGVEIHLLSQFNYNLSQDQRKNQWCTDKKHARLHKGIHWH